MKINVNGLGEQHRIQIEFIEEETQMSISIFKKYSTSLGSIDLQIKIIF